MAQLAAAAGIERLVHVSAIGADPASPSAYGRSKGEGEAAVRAAFPQATILRPSIVFGPEDQFFNRFAGMARMLPFMPVVSGATRFQPVYVGDVADAVAAAAEHEEAPGRSYELCGPGRSASASCCTISWRSPATAGRWWTCRPVSCGCRRGCRIPAQPAADPRPALMLQRDNICTGEAPGLPALGISPKAMEAVVPGYLLRFRPGGGRRPQHAG
ncbi:sugar nucleotide-binding protein [Siccirubricoccus deserti]